MWKCKSFFTDFNVTFDQLNESLLNKNNNFFQTNKTITGPKYLNGSVHVFYNTIVSGQHNLNDFVYYYNIQGHFCILFGILLVYHYIQPSGLSAWPDWCVGWFLAGQTGRPVGCPVKPCS